ncbi:protein DYAD, partial [Hevea brasiliensis]|uniref:protein DYAD n=1 Tax=Hevea brasiliensis TaxID=3981 RepID=UPI0025F745B7
KGNNKAPTPPQKIHIWADNCCRYLHQLVPFFPDHLIPIKLFLSVLALVFSSFSHSMSLPSESLLQPQSPSHQCSFMLEDPTEHIKVGSFYELAHSKLPPKFPDQLNSIRVVMVNEKTRMRVSLRFPSIYSLRAYFRETNCTKPDVKKLPALDEKYIIGSEVAAEALYRRIPPHEITAKRDSWHFWAVPSIAAEKVSSAPSNSKPTSTVVSKKGSLWSELKGTGMLKWGQRRQVRYLARHVEDKRKMIFSTNVPAKEEEEAGEEEEEEENAEEVASDEDEEEKASDDEKEDDVKAGKSQDTKTNSKRKHHGSICNTQNNNKRPKREKNNQIVACKQKKNKVLKNSIDRWSAERYKLAEVNMLKIMKEQGAVFGKPILRPELRAQARKLIGDTGLLDHLLKHMAGKVAPGGEERFRRRHNAEGAMEYWLEKADLVDIRREAGVQDPYWTPPPGWKPGDHPSQDPICAREIRDLKEEIVKLKRDMEERLSKKHEEELVIVTPIPSVTSHNMENENLLTPLKEMYIDLVNKKAKIEGQLMEISQSLCGMEEQMGKLKTAVEEANRTESSERPALMGLPESTSPTGTQRERKEAVMQQKKEATVSRELRQEHSVAGSNKTPPTAKSPAPTEDKAAKIERLKSGFRICKPQGTFLWPNMVISSPQVVVQLEDLFAVPTPPSVSSTSATQSHLPAPPSQHHGPIPTSTLKPLAEKRPVTVALSTAVTRPIHSPGSTQYENSSISTTSAASTTTSTITSLLNLNEPPSNIQNDNGLSGSQSHVQTSNFPVTYQRRGHHAVTAIATMPCLEPAKKEMNQWEEGNDEQEKKMMRYCEQQQQGCCSASSTSPCLSVEVGAWLALATSNQPSDNKSTRG